MLIAVSTKMSNYVKIGFIYDYLSYLPKKGDGAEFKAAE
ncbi:hypothetical protein TPER_HE00396 [Candidatus Hoaglandella endobia]|uniref:Uncharacterized protein n=1 Tax=Candidatus Hoaglandella endobia TaxID=1778263 RepID=A0A143WUM7_9ENTR|nr:hypothetical protein TPER_HE00396 [Candidatus Hoaglandella endobia]